MKPYRFVPLNREVKRSKALDRDQLHKDRYHGKWVIRGTTLTPLVIGTGSLALANGQLVKGIVTLDNIPVIPGSTLKGASRSLAEALSHSCITPVISKKLGDLREYYPRGNSGKCTGEDGICPSCQLYGYVNRGKVASSLVQFSDVKLDQPVKEAVTTGQIPSLFGPLRDKSALDLYVDDEKSFQRKLYRHGKPQTHGGEPYRMVRAGSTFTGEIHYTNLTAADLGLLAFSLGISDPSFAIKLGYGKPAFYGSIRFELLKVEPYQSFGYTSLTHTKEDIIRMSVEYGEGDPFLMAGKEKVRDILNFERDRRQEWAINPKTGQKGY